VVDVMLRALVDEWEEEEVGNRRGSASYIVRTLQRVICVAMPFRSKPN
jgi:epoxyqueuosine reductase QueG